MDGSCPLNREEFIIHNYTEFFFSFGLLVGWLLLRFFLLSTDCGGVVCTNEPLFLSFLYHFDCICGRLVHIQQNGHRFLTSSICSLLAGCCCYCCCCCLLLLLLSHSFHVVDDPPVFCFQAYVSYSRHRCIYFVLLTFFSLLRRFHSLIRLVVSSPQFLMHTRRIRFNTPKNNSIQMQSNSLKRAFWYACVRRILWNKLLVYVYASRSLNHTSIHTYYRTHVHTIYIHAHICHYVTCFFFYNSISA